MIRSVELIVGLEVHVELSARTKMFSAVASPAAALAGVGEGEHAEHAPNTLIDPLTLALPGSLPTINRAAVEASIRAGLALGCTIARTTKWDRKSYFYPDMPKAYQISQYDLPLCFDGAVDVPAADEKGFPDYAKPSRRIGIIRAHLEEDAGKLLHEAPGGHAIDHSIVDLNRAGTALLEIVTQPDFRDADEVVLFAKQLRATLRYLGVTRGVMQEGHLRFEPNINCVLTLDSGRVVRTPIVEVKNLNSFRALRGAIEHERVQQPQRWMENQKEHGAGMKITRGWDDAREVTFVQREKEDAHDYRYFPDPDLPALAVDPAWVESLAVRRDDLPAARIERGVRELELHAKEASALFEERAVCVFFDSASDALVGMGVERARAGRVVANLILQQLYARASARGVDIDSLGIAPQQLAAIGALRELGEVNNQAVDVLLDACAAETFSSVAPAEALAEVRRVAQARGVLIVRDDAALAEWVQAAIEAHPAAAADVRAGKMQAIGRLVGEAMKRAGGKGDAATIRAALLRAMGQ